MGRGARPAHPQPLAAPGPCGALTTMEVGKPQQDVCPGGKGCGFDTELVSFCHRGLRYDQGKLCGGGGRLSSPHFPTET